MRCIMSTGAAVSYVTSEGLNVYSIKDQRAEAWEYGYNYGALKRSDQELEEGYRHMFHYGVEVRQDFLRGHAAARQDLRTAAL